MANEFGFFNYLRLKFFVTLLRTVLIFQSWYPLRRDRLLAQRSYLSVRKQRVRIPSRDLGRYIDGDLYNPEGSDSGPKPVLVNWHGSGWVLPLLGSDELFCKRVAYETGICVLDADYRKAPETPFPGPLNDVEDALRWVATKQDLFDSKRVALSGWSAGAQLALVAATELRTKVFKPSCILDIVAVVAFYPETDLAVAPETKTVPNPIKAHPPFMLHFFHDCFVPDKSMRADPLVSPSRADPASFPSTVAILTCEGDTFAPEALELAEKLDDGKREVVVKNLEGVHHGFDKGAERGTKEWDRREEAYGLAVECLRKVFK